MTIDMNELNSKVPGIKKRLYRIDMPKINISSANIREAISEGRDISSMVTTPVNELIKNEAVY